MPSSGLTAAGQTAAGFDNVDLEATMHALRVAGQAVELLTTGKITFPRPDAEHLKAVRAGIFGKAQLAEMLEAALVDIDQAAARSSLPRQPDQAAIDDLIMRAHLSQLGAADDSDIGQQRAEPMPGAISAREIHVAGTGLLASVRTNPLAIAKAFHSRDFVSLHGAAEIAWNGPPPALATTDPALFEALRCGGTPFFLKGYAILDRSKLTALAIEQLEPAA